MLSQPTPLTGAKILITGITGQIAFPLAQFLAEDNDVWGLARFGDAGSRQQVEAIGVTPVQCDLAAGDLSGVPDDFTHVLHLAAFQGPGNDFDVALAHAFRKPCEVGALASAVHTLERDELAPSLVHGFAPARW